MKRVLSELLNLPDVVVESSLQEGKTLILSVTKKTKSAVCRYLRSKVASFTPKSKLLNDV